MADALKALNAAGVSIWLDDLSRERLTSGSLAAMIERMRVESHIGRHRDLLAATVTEANR